MGVLLKGTFPAIVHCALMHRIWCIGYKLVSWFCQVKPAQLTGYATPYACMYFCYCSTAASPDKFRGGRHLGKNINAGDLPIHGRRIENSAVALDSLSAIPKQPENVKKIASPTSITSSVNYSELGRCTAPTHSLTTVTSSFDPKPWSFPYLGTCTCMPI